MKGAKTATATGSSLLTAPTVIRRGCIKWHGGMSVAVVVDCTGYYCQGRIFNIETIYLSPLLHNAVPSVVYSDKPLGVRNDYYIIAERNIPEY